MTDNAELYFDDVVNRIKNHYDGTLIVITGRAGCGKTTLALKLLKEINGNADMRVLIAPEDVRYLDKVCTEKDRAYLIDDSSITGSRMNDPADTITRMVDKMGLILILIVPDMLHLPRQYRGPYEDGVNSECRITFDCTGRGTFNAEGYVRWLDGRIRTYTSSGKIAQDDVDAVFPIQEQWLRMKMDGKSWKP